ncbi:hypothetical protein C8R45DRAFT_959989 [Mycena sanguinolenta]|nr:hypothetical protein C8R45DRAFT_959989 [Mycena sanguinolenta]
MDLLEKDCLALSKERFERSDSQMNRCIDIISKAEVLEMNVESGHLSTPFFVLLRRVLEEKQSLFTEPSHKRRFLALKRRWDRLQVAAVGYSWSNMFPPSVVAIPALPREVLLEILWSHVADTHETLRQQWAEQANFALNCALVSKAWNAAATHLLYRGVIRLFKTTSAQKLLRTLTEDRPHPRAISHLVLSPSFSEEKNFSEVVFPLLRCCPALRILQLSATELLRVPSIAGSLENLRELQLQGVSLKEFAPMLTKLPNLSILVAEEVQNGRVVTFKSGTEPPGDSLAGIPAPTYHLAELHMKGMLLTPEQVRWIIGASDTLDFVTLHGIYAPSLARILGPLVKSLRLTVGESSIRAQRIRLAAILPMFSALVSLQLCGEDWLLEAPLFRTINAPLTELAISWSPSGFENVFDALKDALWQPLLREIRVCYSQANLDVVAVHPASQKLRDLCDNRNITLRWFSEKGMAGSLVPID